VGVWRDPVGDLLVCATTLLRDDARGGGQVPQGGQRAALPRQHTKARLRADEALLEPQTAEPAAVPLHLPHARRHPDGARARLQLPLPAQGARLTLRNGRK
jgi:hypothetical protein